MAARAVEDGTSSCGGSASGGRLSNMSGGILSPLPRRGPSPLSFRGSARNLTRIATSPHQNQHLRYSGGVFGESFMSSQTTSDRRSYKRKKPGISRGPGFCTRASSDIKTIAGRLWLFCSGDLNRRSNPVRGASLLGPRDGLPVPHRRRSQHHAAHTCVSGGAATINFETAKQEMNPFHPTLHSRV